MRKIFLQEAACAASLLGATIALVELPGLYGLLAVADFTAAVLLGGYGLRLLWAVEIGMKNISDY